MRAEDDPLWHRIANHVIGPPDASLTFAARLARENRWSLAQAEAVIVEYKRFCYLAMMAGHEVTPSDAVDQAWHLHLTYSRDYWEVFCPEVLAADLHHGPTKGGSAERHRFYHQYSATLAAYESAFGAPPPTDIWPAADKRFGVDPYGVRVNLSGVIVLKRRVALAAGLITLMVGWLAGRI
jgi:hypothetical protein